VEATVTVDPQGHVVEASITRGQPPFSDAVIGALRTWRFGAVEAGTPLSFTLRAEFVASGDAQRVTLELKDPREAEAAVAAAEPPPAPAAAPPGASAPPPDTAPSPDAPAPAATTPEVPPTAPAPAPAPATPTPAPVPEAPPATLPAAPPGTIPAPPPVAVPPAAPPSTMPPPAAPPSTMAPPTAPPSTTAPPSAPSSITPPSATPPATTPRSTAVPSRQQPPAEEVIPAAPVAPATAATTPPAVINEEGMSAIRDVTLSPGVPDLPKGRRPVVPPIARLQGVTGTVEVMFLVEGSGQTVVRDVTGPEMLREAARSTVASWSFRRLRPERLPLKAVFNYGKEIATAVVGPQ
jgi:hypothetical protein